MIRMTRPVTRICTDETTIVSFESDDGWVNLDERNEHPVADCLEAAATWLREQNESDAVLGLSLISETERVPFPEGHVLAVIGTDLLTHYVLTVVVTHG